MKSSPSSFEISIAPMLGITNRHSRYLYRLLSQHTLLYSEMVTVSAILYGGKERFLKHNPPDDLLALQLAGSVPKDLAGCAKFINKFSYHEINLNTGCPSKRAQAGEFGACLMLRPNLVAECVAAITEVTSIPVSVKTRLGIAEYANYETLTNFISLIAKAGCKKFIVHARCANLRGLSPRQNRSKLPLNYEMVYRLKRDFPSLKIVLNGEISSCDEVRLHQSKVDGVMLGRAIHKNPYLLAQIEQEFFSKVDEVMRRLPAREEILNKYLAYVDKQESEGVSKQLMLRPVLGLFHGMPNAKEWRQQVSNS